MSEKKIDLIAQMLAKAESTTPEEAEALMEHAERLMIKYSIDQAVIDSRRATGQEEKIVTVKIQFSGAYRLDHTRLGASVANALGNLRLLQSTYKNKFSWLHIIGFESDVRQAETLIRSLQVQSMVATRAWWKTHKGEYSLYTSYDQEAARRSFVVGFGAGAGERIRASRQQVVAEAGTGTELVLVSREAKVQAHFDTLQTRPSRARGGKGSPEARVSGYQAGQQANTGEKSLSQGRAVSA